jgi:hypothetical protein
MINETKNVWLFWGKKLIKIYEALEERQRLLTTGIKGRHHYRSYR